MTRTATVKGGMLKTENVYVDMGQLPVRDTSMPGMSTSPAMLEQPVVVGEVK